MTFFKNSIFKIPQLILGIANSELQFNVLNFFVDFSIKILAYNKIIHVRYTVGTFW